MTDQEIRDWIRCYNEGARPYRLSDDDIYPLLKELLSYRALNFLPCWRVWCPDPNPPGWRWLGAFPTRERALQYREAIAGKFCLVLEGHEQPSETAR